MDFSLTEAQEMLRTSTRGFLETECPKTLVREMESARTGYSPQLWRKMAELGWMGLLLPEEYGGADFTFQDMAIVLEEMGRALLPGPYFSTVVLCGQAILNSGTEQQRLELLGRIGSGELVMALALTEPSASYHAKDIMVRANLSGDKYTISGAKSFVSDAQDADYFIVVTRTADSVDPEQGISLFLVEANSPGITINPLAIMGIDKQAQVIFQDVQVDVDQLLGLRNGGWPLVEKLMAWGAAGKCAEAVGGAQVAMELAVHYVNNRQAFGQTIGSLQAIQHHCANMFTAVETSRNLAYQAAWLVAKGETNDAAISEAKAWISEAYSSVTSLAHQCHGCIAFTKEMDIHLYHKKAKVSELLFGDAPFHWQRIANNLGANISTV